MTRHLLLLSICAVLCTLCLCMRNFAVYRDKKISHEYVTSTREAPSACACQMRCFVDSTCLAVSAEMKTGSNKCSFSTYVGVVSSLVSANNSEGNDVGQFTSNISTLTFVRKGCREIFDQVGSTCYFFSRRKADFKSATASCPASSALAFPSTEFKFKTLVDYMKKEKLDSDEWYVDLTLQNGKWFWSDGTEMTASRYLGDDVTIPCARIQDNSHLNDIDCSREFNFICQYEAQA